MKCLRLRELWVFRIGSRIELLYNFLYLYNNVKHIFIIILTPYKNNNKPLKVSKEYCFFIVHFRHIFMSKSNFVLTNNGFQL